MSFVSNNRIWTTEVDKVEKVYDLYRLSDRLVVFLGFEEDDSAHALGLLDFLGSYSEQDTLLNCESGIQERLGD